MEYEGGKAEQEVKECLTLGAKADEAQEAEERPNRIGGDRKVMQGIRYGTV